MAGCKLVSEKRESRLEAYVDSQCMPGSTKVMVRDSVISFSQKERKFGFRSVSRTYIEVKRLISNKEHDAFESLGG